MVNGPQAFSATSPSPRVDSQIEPVFKMYPEQCLGHRFLHCLCEAPQVAVQRRVHHAGVHGVHGHGEAAGRQLLLQVVGEEDQSQFALGVGTMGTVVGPGDRERGGAPSLWSHTVIEIYMWFETKSNRKITYSLSPSVPKLRDLNQPVSLRSLQAGSTHRRHNMHSFPEMRLSSIRSHQCHALLCAFYEAILPWKAITAGYSLQATGLTSDDGCLHFM